MPDIIGIGEILVDFIATEPGPYDEVPGFLRCFGGAPMNCVMGAAKLGVSSGAIAAVGDDPFGDFLTTELERWGVDTSHVVRKRGKRTTITFVANDPVTGERTFLFYRRPWVDNTADSSLSPEDVDPDYVLKTKILHVSGFAMSQSPSREAVLKAIDCAKDSKVKVSFDPTLRIDVWDSIEILRNMYEIALKRSDVATFSKEEAEYILGTSEPEKAAEKALSFGLELVGIKLGAEGSFIMTKEGEKVRASAFKIKPVDTTGAGDVWNAALLVGLIKGWDLERCILSANAIGALKCTQRGAITSMPTLEEAEEFINGHAKEVCVSHK